MSTNGFLGYYIETRDYAATAAVWKSLGFENLFETDHRSGEWQHPSGGPYVFIAEQHDSETLETHPILAVADAGSFAVDGLVFAKPFTAEHWGMSEALVLDPDGRQISLQAPLS